MVLRALSQHIAYMLLSVITAAQNTAKHSGVKHVPLDNRFVHTMLSGSISRGVKTMF